MQSSARCFERGTSRGDVRALEFHGFLEPADAYRVGKERLRPNCSGHGTDHDQRTRQCTNGNADMSDGRREKLAALMDTHVKSLPHAGVQTAPRRSAFAERRNACQMTRQVLVRKCCGAPRGRTAARWERRMSSGAAATYTIGGRSLSSSDGPGGAHSTTATTVDAMVGAPGSRSIRAGIPPCA